MRTNRDDSRRVELFGSTASGKGTTLSRAAKAAERSRALAPGVPLSCARPSRLSQCGNRVEILWDARIDRVLRELYVCRVSRTAGFALAASPSRPEGAPLRRKAIRSL